MFKKSLFEIQLQMNLNNKIKICARIIPSAICRTMDYCPLISIDFDSKCLMTNSALHLGQYINRFEDFETEGCK